METTERFYTLAAAARKIDVSRATLHAAIKRGELQIAENVEGASAVSETELLRWNDAPRKVGGYPRGRPRKQREEGGENGNG